MKRFDLITEADARRLPEGETVELRPGGRVTPLARDTLRARRVVVVSDALADGAQALRLANDVRRLMIGADHTGLALRDALVRWGRSRGLRVVEEGAQGSARVDYPDVAAAVARAVMRDEADAGVVIDGSGVGSAMAANKVPGIRAASCSDPAIARYAREHTGANVIALGSTLVGPDEACQILQAWLETRIQEPRYIRRLEKLHALEREGQAR
jgi:ribose 5-phosphate isomerase B